MKILGNKYSIVYQSGYFVFGTVYLNKKKQANEVRNHKTYATFKGVLSELHNVGYIVEDELTFIANLKLEEGVNIAKQTLLRGS